MTDDLNYLGRVVDPSGLGDPGMIPLDVIQVPDSVKVIGFEGDELTCRCPVTGQPDFYQIAITIFTGRRPLTIETKSLKLYLQSFAQSTEGIFAEVLSSMIAEKIGQATGQSVEVRLKQKPRGGISITASSLWEPRADLSAEVIKAMSALEGIMFSDLEGEEE